MSSIDLSLLSFEELIELSGKVNFLINNYKDEYFYICEVRSYGSSHIQTPLNTHVLTELTHLFNGDDGIMDVYTNNPSLEISNYGDVFYIKSKEDFYSWREYSLLKQNVETIKEELNKSKVFPTLPLSKQPLFGSIYEESDLIEAQYKFEHFKNDFSFPVLYSERQCVL
jgi:hypothetical protein